MIVTCSPEEGVLRTHSAALGVEAALHSRPQPQPRLEVVVRFPRREGIAGYVGAGVMPEVASWLAWGMGGEGKLRL